MIWEENKSPVMLTWSVLSVLHVATVGGRYFGSSPWRHHFLGKWEVNVVNVTVPGAERGGQRPAETHRRRSASSVPSGLAGEVTGAGSGAERQGSRARDPGRGNDGNKSPDVSSFVRLRSRAAVAFRFNLPCYFFSTRPPLWRLRQR